MYEDQTYGVILQSMLDRVPNGIDKREGSIIYDSLAPAAAELAQAYIELDNTLALGFAETASDEWLEKRTKELGVERKQATKAVRQASFNTSVSVGERFFVDDQYYVVTEAGTTAKVECETAGTVGNRTAAGEAMLPINNISGLTSAVLGDVLIPGEDTETDESLFERYQEKINKQATSGNKNQYYQWAKDVDGVGEAKVFPLWNGDNTVKIVMVNSEMGPASTALVQEVQDYIDPGITGLGEGVAPIGAFCTVESATEKLVDVSASLTLAEGKTLADAQLDIETALADYFKSIAFKETVLRYAQIGTLILNSPSIIDYSDLLINHVAANIQLLDTEIPALGVVILS